MNPFRSVSTILIFTIAFAASAFAQTELGRISGRVVDVQGAVVPGATITVTNTGTNEKRTVTANDEGVYVVPALKAAVYKIEGSAASFAVKNITNVQVSVGQQLNLDVELAPDTQTVTVDVTDATEVGIDTSSARIGATVNQREVHDLPLNGRQLSQLYLQAPGSVNSGSGTFSDIRFSGRAVQQNVVRYDGVEGTAIIDASPGNLNGEVPSKFRLQSSLENVQEFKVDSSNFPAELGTGTGGQISVVTKSGTNEFHGSAFEYFRNDAFDSRNFFDNIQPGVPKSELSLHQFGGSFGGPIIKNKLFFFGSYEGYRVKTGLNFVEAAPSLGRALPGELIPGKSTPVNPAIQPYIQGFRSPNAVTVPGSQTAGFDIVQLQDSAKINEDAYSLRLDFNANENNNFYFRFFRDNGTDTSPEGVSGRIVKITAQPQNGVFGWTSVINQNLLNDFRIGYNGARTRINGQAPTINGLDFSAVTLNISGSVAISGIAGQGTSSGISIPGGLVRANSATNGRGQPYTPYSYSFIDSLSWTRGNHNIKFGGEVRFIRLYTDRLGGTTYTFSNLAGFLNNAPQSVQYVGDLSSQSPFTGLTGERLAQQEYYIGYGQDEWKIKPGLTLSYGLRYEYYAPLREKNNGQVLFNIEDGTYRDPSEAAFKSSKNNWGPRVAVTWSPNQSGTGFFSGGKSVFRGGFGYYYGPGQTEDQIQPIESDRIQTTITSGGLLAFPANLPAIVANFNSNPLNRQYQPRAYSNNYQVPERILQYSASYQQELPGRFVSTIAYVGSKGTNLFLRSVANQILPGATTITNGSNLPSGFGVINRVDPVTGRVVGVNTVREFDVLSGTTQNRPFAEVDYKTSGGDDRYDALQASLSRRASNGLTLNAQYTYGFSRGNTAGSNEARTSGALDDFDYDRGRNNFDVRHTFNVSAVYELPIGKGKPLDLGNSFANYILGDWEVGGILNARSGLPIEVLVVRPDVVIQCTSPAAGCVAGTVLPLPGTVNAASPLPAGYTAVINTPGGGASRNVRRPNMTGEPFYLDNDRNILNPAAFSIPLPGEFGDLPRNALRGPIFRQFDLILAKKFRITERVNLQFRSEIFNIFNTTNFANPSATLNNALSASFQPGAAFTQSLAGATFGQVRQTVERTVGLGTNRQIQFALRLNF
jgi:hypothetical protein